MNIIFTSVNCKYPIVKNEINYDPLVNKSVYETHYKEIIFENVIINSTNVKNNFVFTNNHGLVKVIHII